MKMKTLLQTVVISILFAYNAHALDISFGDTAKYWPGWGGGVCSWNSGITDNSRDVIGSPDIAGGKVSVNGGNIDTVTLIYSNLDSYSSITPGDLFIDMGSDGDWNFVVDTSSRDIYSFAPGAFLLSAGAGYSLSGDCDNWSGDGPNRAGVWQPPYSATWDIRDNHPVLYKLDGGICGYYLGQASITPATFNTAAGNNLTYSYSNLGLGLDGSSFTLGWTISCANDVLYEKVSSPVPEPATLLLLGVGMLGLAGLRKKIK